MSSIFVCIAYLVGFSCSFAYDDLSHNKEASQLHTYSGLNNDANKAVDRNTTTCMRTESIGRTDLEKTVWWKVDLGGVYNIYSIDILFKIYAGYESRQRGRFAGFSLYVSNTNILNSGALKNSTLCYKDGPQLPPLNFTSRCTTYGRYVIFYNERLDEVIYPAIYETSYVLTELCEVIVHGCKKPGVYGINCDNPCPINCKYNLCHLDNGMCYSCFPGWMGATCGTRCRNGWYGVNCSQQCTGHCKDGLICNHLTGQCDRGCDAGWTGSFCDKSCENGSYGFDCINNCTGHCLKNHFCNKQTGHCDMGCNPGYTNNYCSKMCPPGYFGIGCSSMCSGHCIRDEPCDHVSGVCSNGCQDGYVGTHCKSSCNDGYYGRHCSQVCPFTCQTCRHTDGMCTCKAGWMGLRCTTECIQSFGENCQYHCNKFCINQTCDRFNGMCLYGCKNGKKCYDDADNLRIAYSTKTASSPNLWIVGFSISLALNVFVISAVLILCYRKKKNKSPGNQSDNNDTASHYQELTVCKGDNSYKNLTPT